jgi:AraC-like DNA-binding protein
MAIRFFQPAEDLRDVIARIYVHDSDACDLAERRWLIVPDGDIKLIFPFSGDIRCTIGDAGRLHGTSRMIVSGMRTLPGYLEFSASLGAVGVIVRPEAAYRLLGVPQHEIANRTLDADEVLGRAMRPWQDRLMDGSKAQERVDRMQAALRDWLKGRDRRDQVLEYAVRRLRRHEGRVRIEELARETGWSRRQLERRFQNHVGVGPKSMASIFRFQAVYRQRSEGCGVAMKPAFELPSRPSDLAANSSIRTPCLGGGAIALDRLSSIKANKASLASQHGDA